MLKKIIYFLIIFIGFGKIAVSQTEVMELNVEPYLKSNKFNEILPFYNSENNETAIFLREWSDLTLLLVDSLNELNSSVQGQLPRVKPLNLAGISYSDHVYCMYSMPPSKSVLGVTTFDVSNNESTRKSGYINLKRGEKVLGYYSYKNDFYIISIFEKSSNINLIKYQGGEEVGRQNFSFDDNLFPHFLSNNLFNCIYFEKAPMRSSGLYTALVNSNSSDYLEVINDNLYIISNTNTVVSINLESGESKVVNFPIIHQQQGQSLKGTPLKNLVKQPKTKSCVVDNHFFRLNLFEKVFDLEVYNIETKELVIDIPITSETESIKIFRNSYEPLDDQFSELTFEALKHGKLNFSVTKTSNHFNVKIGKTSSPKFWNRFDQSILNKKSKETFFDRGFIGIFYDHNENFVNYNFTSPLFFEKYEERRIAELNFDLEGKILNLENEENNVNKFFDVSGQTNHFQLNSLFLRNNRRNFIILEEDKHWIKVYE